MTSPSTKPAWVADAIFYQIFPDRFARSERSPKNAYLEPWDGPPTLTGYKGGDLWGIVERLDWVSDLGCTAIYFNPVFQSASNHRYHTHDYFRIDPLLGGDEAFEAMLGACHDRGIRVLLDGVFNHASRGFFQFNDLLESGPASPYRDWFHVHAFPVEAYTENGDPAETYTAWWGIPALPKFRTENPETREFLMRVAEHWIDRGIDGWRLDVPEEVQTKGFWEEFRERVRARNSDAYLVGEIWGDASTWTNPGTRFDGTMNYLLTGAILSFVDAGRIDWSLVDRLNYPLEPTDGWGFADQLHQLNVIYPHETQRAHLNLLGSHDTARVLSVLGGDTTALELALVLQFALPGAPSIYYGDEIGLMGGHDPDCRAAFPWDEPGSWNTAVLETTRRLAALRHAEPALRHGPVEVLGIDQNLVVIARRHEDSTLIVAVNAGTTAENVTCDLPIRDAHTLWGSGGIASHGDTLHIAMAPRSSAIWRIGPAEDLPLR